MFWGRPLALSTLDDDRNAHCTLSCLLPSLLALHLGNHSSGIWVSNLGVYMQGKCLIAAAPSLWPHLPAILNLQFHSGCWRDSGLGNQGPSLPTLQSELPKGRPRTRTQKSHCPVPCSSPPLPIPHPPIPLSLILSSFCPSSPLGPPSCLPVQEPTDPATTGLSPSQRPHPGVRGCCEHHHGEHHKKQ